MHKQQILIVEDEMNIAEVQIAYCKNAGYGVTHMAGGKGVIEHVKNNRVDLILLDLNAAGQRRHYPVQRNPHIFPGSHNYGNRQK